MQLKRIAEPGAKSMQINGRINTESMPDQWADQ